MTHHITDRLGPMVDKALDQHAQGETVVWEHTLLADRQGVPHYLLAFWFKGISPGEAFNASMNVHDPIGITEEQMNESIRQMIEQFRSARTQQLAQEAPQQPPRPGMNGSGLIIPGRN